MRRLCDLHNRPIVFGNTSVSKTSQRVAALRHARTHPKKDQESTTRYLQRSLDSVSFFTRWHSVGSDRIRPNVERDVPNSRRRLTQSAALTPFVRRKRP